MKIFESNFVDADMSLDLKLFGKYIAFLRRQPVHSIRLIWGIKIPPHEGYMIRAAWMGYSSNIFTCSRGTSKSFTIGSLFAPTKALLYRGKSILIASASRFRGGKMVLKDSANLLAGALKNQQVDNNWGRYSLVFRASYIRREPDIWHIDFRSNSNVYTIPTNNEESVRGLRANILILDERNTFDGELIQKVYMPFLNVGSDFEDTASGSEDNQSFSVGTIDYTHRDWFKEISAAQDLARVQYDIQKAMREQNWPVYDALMRAHNARVKEASISIVRYDYTDLLIPTVINGYKVNYPGAKPGKQIRFDERDQVEYIYTYPIQKKKLEDPLFDGVVDRETWEAEQRNMFIRADGNVYPFDLIEKVNGPIFGLTEELKRGWNSESEGFRYLPPVLFNSTDPCVLGVDVARTSAYSAFVVIRMGDVSDEFFKEKHNDYTIKDHAGPSPWSNVIWAEQHQQMTVKEVAEKIRHLRSRYNIVATRVCPGVVVDLRGGGVNVRDELVMPSPPVDEHGLAVQNWAAPQRIFDPEDKDARLGKDLLAEPTAWFGLKLLDTTDLLNVELVGFSKAQMQTGKLFIGTGKNRAVSMRNLSDEKYLGYIGVEILKHQLLRVQASPTPAGRAMRYKMPGREGSPETQKDMFSAFLYACYGLKQWVTEQGRRIRKAPEAYGEVVVLPSRF